jgi:hypothetical protein
VVAPPLAQSRETLETKVTVSGDRVQLEWSARHPWDEVLRTRPPGLLAEYRLPGGQVALDCLAGAASGVAGRGCQGVQGMRDRDPKRRLLTYVLPATLTRVPEGAACLLFRLPDQRPLPLRRADRDRTETTRFRYLEWEALARADGERGASSRRVAEARSALEAKRAELAAAERQNGERGWGSAAACAAIPAPDLGEVSENRPVAEMREHAIVARQVCVMRVRNAAEQAAGLDFGSRLAAGVVLPPSMLDSVLALLPRRTGAAAVLTDERQQQLTVFRRDYTQFAPQVERYRSDVRQAGYDQPHFGTFGSLLRLQTIGTDAGTFIARALQQGAALPPHIVLGWVGGNLEAYTRCVDDGQAQLATSATSAAELASRRPAQQEAARQALVKTCEGGVARVEALRASLSQLERQLADAERAANQPRGPAPLPDRAREVNLEACVP